MQTKYSKIYSKCGTTAVLCCLVYVFATGQTVENVHTILDQSRQQVRILFDLKGLDYKKEIQVIPEVILSDSTALSIHALSGDSGWINQAGKNKELLWDPFKDGVNSLVGVRIHLKTVVRHAAKIPRYRALALHGSNSAPMGLKFMKLGQVGFFAGFRLGKLPLSHRYTVTISGVINYPGVYEIVKEKRLASYAITGGPLVQLSRRIYGYAGVGYGLEQLYWRYQVYNRDKVPGGRYWALVQDFNRNGIAVDAGTVVRLGRWFLDLGLCTIIKPDPYEKKFQSLQIIGGIGHTF